MKKLIICFILALMAGCHSTKKAVKTEVETASSTVITQATTSNYDAKLVNDIISALKMKITTTKYFPPSGSPGTDPNKGAVESETTLEAISETTDKSTAEVKQGEESNTSINNNDNSSTKTEVKEKPAPDPYRWRYILGILVILAIGILYFKRKTAFPWIKSVLSPAGKNQKI